ncbi:MAG: AbrB/MazE/SpoVT family DNA-binding domain-containing protein [Nitrospirae bacterium]|nr:AbrB/MazE/SpoVT family DNA-binding domain-containing protein [Nitrospirota bacterium]
MIITLSARGTITIPQEIRKKLGIVPGDPLDITVEKGCLVLTPVAIVPKTPKQTKSGMRKKADAE